MKLYCPRCKKKVEAELRLFQWRKMWYCPNCGELLFKRERTK